MTNRFIYGRVGGWMSETEYPSYHDAFTAASHQGIPDQEIAISVVRRDGSGQGTTVRPVTCHWNEESDYEVRDSAGLTVESAADGQPRDPIPMPRVSAADLPAAVWGWAAAQDTMDEAVDMWMYSFLDYLGEHNQEDLAELELDTIEAVESAFQNYAETCEENEEETARGR